MVLDAVFLLIVLAILAGVFRVAPRLSTWRSERRMRQRGKGDAERIDNLRELARLRDDGSLSQEEFEAARARVHRE
jgi:cytochrome c-type biogenesis protein CcmH/NrfG